MSTKIEIYHMGNGKYMLGFYNKFGKKRFRGGISYKNTENATALENAIKGAEHFKENYGIDYTVREE